MKKILLIGGNGYIGSQFYNLFKDKYNITIIDICWFSEKNNILDFNNLNKDYINLFDVVILLAGHSSVKMCDNDMMSSFNNNVKNYINLLEKINDTQKFIYASSSSVYGNTNYNIVDEMHFYFEPNNYYDMTKHIIDLYAIKSNKNFYGLRFGTVNGWSPNLRTDVMINSMVSSALSDGHIKLYVKEIMRPILGINDLCGAIEKIILTENSIPGIYNLASFNKTAEEIATGVSKALNVPIVEYNIDKLETITNVKLQSKSYNFAIDSKKFNLNFNYSFSETIESITNSLVNNYVNCNKSTRNVNIKYE